MGEWKDGHQDGLGTYCWPSGSLYAVSIKSGDKPKKYLLWLVK